MTSKKAHQIAALIERLGRLLSANANVSGLQPVHWETLRFLNRANRFSKNSAALTAYLGSTKGTVSQTVKTLVAKGLIKNRPHAQDRRRNQLSLTGKAKKLLNEDPMIEIAPVVENLPEKTRTDLAEGLQKVLSGCLDAQGRQPFGLCRECSYFAEEHKLGNPHFCRLLNEKLNGVDALSICQEQTSREMCNNSLEDEPAEYASPPCHRHELDPGYGVSN